VTPSVPRVGFYRLRALSGIPRGRSTVGHPFSVAQPRRHFLMSTVCIWAETKKGRKISLVGLLHWIESGDYSRCLCTEDYYALASIITKRTTLVVLRAKEQW
jgi:hypothetical protein